MNLSQVLMAAEAQIDAKAAFGLPFQPSEAEQLCRFLRECAVEAMELEAVVYQPFFGDAGCDVLSTTQDDRDWVEAGHVDNARDDRGMGAGPS